MVLANDLLTFAERFACKPAMHFSDLWCLTDTVYERYEFMEMLEEHTCLRDGAVDDGWEEMLSKQKFQRLQGYRARYGHVLSEHPPNTVDFAFDLDHNPFKRPVVSIEERKQPAQLGTLISHGSIWHDSHRRPLLSSEWCLAQGLCPSKQLAASLGTRVPVDMWDLMTSGTISLSATRSMAGNAWNIPTFGSFMMFFLASVELKGRHQKVKKWPVAIDDEDDNDALDFLPKKKRQRQTLLPTVSYD